MVSFILRIAIPLYHQAVLKGTLVGWLKVQILEPDFISLLVLWLVVKLLCSLSWCPHQ